MRGRLPGWELFQLAQPGYGTPPSREHTESKQPDTQKAKAVGFGDPGCIAPQDREGDQLKVCQWAAKEATGRC